MSAAYLKHPSPADAAVQPALGARKAQETLAGIAGSAPLDSAYLAAAELAGVYGWKSAAVRCFILELAKRAAR